jgi:hypothetical protein
LSDGGKGWAQRPIQDRKQFEENWDKIFKSKSERALDWMVDENERLGLYDNPPADKDNKQ